MNGKARIGIKMILAFGLCGLGGARPLHAAEASAMGPLRVHPDNPRYFQNQATGDLVYLTGSHVWYNLVDMGPEDPPEPFDFERYLDWLKAHHHNFIRLWTWELTQWNTENNSRHHENPVHYVRPHPWARTGPGKALDGKPKFNLNQFNPEYFKRVRSRVKAARERGIYVSIMLFEGWGLQFAPDAWSHHPFHPDNNVNGIDGDANGDGKGLEVHTLENPAVTRLQAKYVSHLARTVNDLDNVLFEVGNEIHPDSTQWQYHLIDYLHALERGRNVHPVGMTFQYKGGKNQTLFDSAAEWVSPNPEGGYRDDPPVNTGDKVVLSDTDHLWGIGGNAKWVWKSFTRGLNPIFMDPYDGVVLGERFQPRWDPIRRNLGTTRRYAEKIDLVEMTPLPELASSRYCLADPGSEYLVYHPETETLTVDLSAAAGKLTVEWFHPQTGQMRVPEPIDGGAKRSFDSPFEEGASVLYLKAE